MAGIRESLDLDITQALNKVKQLEHALDKATGGSRGAPVAPPTSATPGAPGGAGGGMLGGLASAFAAERVFRTLTGAIGSAVSAASELNEQISASEVVFGRSAGAIQKFADSAADIGLAKDEALAAANNFGALFTALGISQQKAAALGPTLIQRAADLASFRNVAGGTNEVIQRLSSGIVGEVEPLRRLGIAINESTVKQKALSMGAVEVNGQLSESAKVQARIALILEQSSIAQGDFARTSDGLANSQRKLAAEFRNIQIEVGGRFLPVILEGTKGLATLMDIFTSLPGPIQTVIVALVGIATAAVGIGLAALAVQRLTAALEQAGIAGGIASTALKGLAIGGGVLFGIAALITLIQSLRSAVKDTADDVRDLSRATDEAAAKQFEALTRPRPTQERTLGQVGFDPSIAFAARQFDDLDKRLKALASSGEQGLGVVVRIRDALKGQGEDTSRLDSVITKETEAQRRANATAKAGQDALGGLGTTTETTADQMSELDKALKDVKDTLDTVLGRFLDVEDATSKLQSATFDLAEALAEGRRKGESVVEFEQRLGDLARSAAQAIENRALALARSGAIDASAASVQAEIRKELEEQIALFPALADQLNGYITLLDKIPTDVFTNVRIQITSAPAATGGGPMGPTADPWEGLGSALAAQIGDGITSNLGAVADAGAQAGHTAAQAAVDEVQVTLRRSARPGQGLDIGGFILSGINLGPALGEINAANMRLAASTGMIQEVIEAAKFDPTEQLAILNAVKAVDQAALDLNEAIKTYGADSLEAAIATQTLATSRADLNKTILDGIDATKTINDLLAEEKDKIDALTESVNASSGALSALRRIEDARDAAAKAAKNAQKETTRLGQFDQRIAETKAELEAIRASGGAGGLDEARAQATLRDLELRRKGQVEKTNDANKEATDANLALVDATLSLASAGLELQNRLPGWVDFFVGVSQAAGLSMASIWLLVDSLNVAAAAAQTTRALVAGAAAPVQLAAAGSTTLAAQSFTKTASTSTGGGIHVDQIGPIYETTDGRGTAIEIADELKAVALLGAS